VVLALLVLLCAGVISFLLRQGNTSALGTPGHVTSVRAVAAAETLSSASYRLTQQVGGPPGLDHASEGRLTL